MTGDEFHLIAGQGFGFTMLVVFGFGFLFALGNWLGRFLPEWATRMLIGYVYRDGRWIEA